MPLPQRLWVSDEELGKKDDDHRYGSKSPMWRQRRPHVRSKSIKRVVVGFFAIFALYVFFKNMPTDLRNPRARPSFDHPKTVYRGIPEKPEAGTTPDLADANRRLFNGPIKFFALAASLRAAQATTKGADSTNRNVLFAASSLKSAASILPVACEMALQEKNYVHFAFMGRDDIPMDMLKAVNRVSEECAIIYHDARPDYSVQSSDYRMEVSCSAAVNHINAFLHPQAIIIDGSTTEDPFFVTALRERTTSFERSLIELPEDFEQSLMWLIQLDSAALGGWTKLNIDILVHAPVGSSGSLIRLLNSLKKADYSSSAPPRLTIELPQDVDPPTRKFLESFTWPPDKSQKEGSLFTIHHRISQRGLSKEESSIRFLEGFWPHNPLTSHALVLSPQTEVSPLYFHYLRYMILEYQHSLSKRDENILGISLDLPSTYLNDTSPFEPPTQTVSTPFMWQAPNSNAMLFFGEKWVELHDLVTRLLSGPNKSFPKLVSNTYPSWLEHILSLARVRGYMTIYPNFDASDALATIHNELYQPPEEYTPNKDMENPDFTADPTNHLSLKHAEKPLPQTSLQSLLPKLPKNMPMLSWEGNPIDVEQMQVDVLQYSRQFRVEFGGCDKRAKEKDRLPLAAWDLFCDGSEELVSQKESPPPL